MDIRAVNGLLHDFFRDRGRFAVVGGYGLLAHGIQRATFDLDLVVENRCQADLIAFLEAKGYETLHRSTGYSNHLHRASDLGRLDFVYVDEQTAETIFEGCEETEILTGLVALVPRPEHLVALKVRALKNDPSRKLQDLADIRELSLLPGIDLDEIRGYFDRLGLSSLFAEIKVDERI